MQELIEKLNIPAFKNKKIIKVENLSSAFGAFCKKIKLDNNNYLIIKGLENKKLKYNSVYYEGLSLKFMSKKFPHIFPKVLYLDKNILVMNFINTDNIRDSSSNKNLVNVILKIHKNRNKFFGFDYDTPIGGLKQPNKYNSSWVDFYGQFRLGMIFEKINSTNPMPKELNISIEKIIKNLKNYIPNNPIPSLIHGDLWEGNILFKSGKLVGLIDPGIHYAHNELELSYLSWFNYVKKDFFDIYNEQIPLHEEYFNYQEIYQLYYSLLNVHLWSRDYISDADKLTKKFI